jgi:hypothetical protein
LGALKGAAFTLVAVAKIEKVSPLATPFTPLSSHLDNAIYWHCN